MPALYAPPAPRTRTHLDAKRADDGAAHRQIVLILRDDVRLVHRAATGGTCPGQRRVVRPIDPPGHRTGAVSAAGGARASARQTAGALSMRFGERRGLPEARPARRVELILKSLVAPFQPIPLVLGARQGVAQLRDLLLLSSSQYGEIVRRQRRAHIGHALVMPETRNLYKYNILDRRRSGGETR